jgi:outer membrane protein assembly factor BamB
MENSKNIKIAIAMMTILLVSSTLILFGNSAFVKPSTTALPLSPTTNYGDLMQYTWNQSGYDEGFSSGSPGPGPEKADVLYKVRTSGSSLVSAFNDWVFVAGGTTVYVYDALTGSSIYNSTAPGTASISGNNAIFQLDDTYFLTQGGTGITVRKISDGTLMWSYDIPGGAHGMPGSGSYFGGRYSTSMKMYFMTISEPSLSDPTKAYAGVMAIDLSNPSINQTGGQPAWIYKADMSLECLCCGGGLLYLGSTEGDIIALNATGQVAWQSALLGGVAQQAAIYYNGNLYCSAVSWYMTCFNGTTGEMLWQTLKGIRAFTAYHGCAGAGMIFDETDEIDPYGSVGAWDATTGEQLWKNTGYYNIRYDTMAYADGKVYGVKCDAAAGSHTSTLVMPGTSFSCWDAYTGEELWNLPGTVFTYPAIAYGNLYGVAGGYLYCIGGSPADWSMGLIGNVAQPRVAVGQQGPTDISTPIWAFQTGSDVYSSPAIVDGKIYFGSDDKNLYCLNAYTGEMIWNFTTGFYLRSSPAVWAGKVFTGADDGYFYGLDANTGTKLWQTSAGGFFPYYLPPGEAKASSSPIVVNNLIYCGSKDGNLYCLNFDGKVQWKFKTGNAILGSPGYLNGIVYITSLDGYLYAVNANTGSQAWKSAFTLNLYVDPPIYSSLYNVCPATAINGVVYVGGGVQYGNPGNDAFFAAQGQSTPAGSFGGGIRMFAFNATTGASIWNVSRAGNTQPNYYPCYVNGQIYAPEFFEVTSMNALRPNTTGTVTPPDFSYTQRRMGYRAWASWTGYQVQASVAYADDLTGAKIYVGSDIGSMYVLNATLGNSTSVFTAGGNVPAAGSIWEGKYYCGCTDGKMYAFDDSPCVGFDLHAASDKGTTMWNNETITVAGRLTSNPDMMVWNYDSKSYKPQASEYHPGLPNATILISVIKPDMTSVNLTATTDQHGYFTISYSPTQTGDWGWVAYYNGMRRVGITYNPAYTEWNPVTVSAPPSTTPVTSSSPSPSPSPAAGTPVEYIYAAIAVIAIIIIAIGAYAYTRRSKK